MRRRLAYYCMKLMMVSNLGIGTSTVVEHLPHQTKVDGSSLALLLEKSTSIKRLYRLIVNICHLLM
jgi:hypothetical protein